MLKTFKIAAIISYLLIIIMGSMIGFPFIVWLLYTLFDFGNSDQFFAFLSILGLVISIATLNSFRNSNILFLDVFCFILLLSPIIRRMSIVPIEYFNYLAFIIPLTVFGLFYILSLYFSFKEYSKNSKALL